MLTIFNRRELISTFSMKNQMEMREKLQNSNIKYKCKVINRNSASPFSSSRMRTGSMGQKTEMTYEYIFYVNRQDYEKAKGLVRS